MSCIAKLLRLSAVMSVVAIQLFAAGSASGKWYTFTEIATSRTLDIGTVFGASINDQGAVAFSAEIRTSQDYRVDIFKWSPGSGVSTAVSDYRWLSSALPPIIDNAGSIAYATRDNGVLVRTAAGAVIPGSIQGRQDLLDFRDGYVLYRSFDDANAPLVSYEAGALNGSVVFDPAFSPYKLVDATLGKSGDVFIGVRSKTLASGLPSLVVNARTGTTVASLTAASSPGVLAGPTYGTIGVTPDGEDIYFGVVPTDSSGPSYIERISADGTGSPSLTSLNMYTGGLFGVAGSNSGQFVFGNGVTNGSVGIIGLFSGPDPEADRVIAIGDPLLDRKIKNLTLGKHILGPNGEVVFGATLNDGSFGVYLAAPCESCEVPPLPSLIPEPATWGLVVAGMVALAFRIRRTTY